MPKCPERSEVQSEFGAEEDVTLDFLQQKTVSSLTLPVKQSRNISVSNGL